MLEIEIKARCASHAEILSRLKDAQAEETGSVEEKDYYYNHPSRDFRHTHEALRLRVENGKCRITYKGPKLPGIAKSRCEAETGIEDFETMRSVLEHLGFVLSGTVEKHRDMFDYNGFTVCLDTVKGLGTFIEIEKLGTDKDAVEKDVLSCAASFGLTEFEPRSYLAMVLEKASTGK